MVYWLLFADTFQAMSVQSVSRSSLSTMLRKWTGDICYAISTNSWHFSLHPSS